jgi:hypothetical protein
MTDLQTQIDALIAKRQPLCMERMALNKKVSESIARSNGRYFDQNAANQADRLAWDINAYTQRIISLRKKQKELAN